MFCGFLLNSYCYASNSIWIIKLPCYNLKSAKLLLMRRYWMKVIWNLLLILEIQENRRIEEMQMQLKMKELELEQFRFSKEK
jgi:hypothetical protein